MQRELAIMLDKFSLSFSGMLGMYPYKKFHLDF